MLSFKHDFIRKPASTFRGVTLSFKHDLIRKPGDPFFGVMPSLPPPHGPFFRTLPVRNGSSPMREFAMPKVKLEAEPEPLSVDLDKAALVIIDMQRDLLEPGGSARLRNDVARLQAAVGPCKDVLEAARRVGMLVIHTREGHRSDLVGRRIGEVGAVAFAGVNDQHPDAPRRLEDILAGTDGGLQPGDVVAESRAEAARLEEIALHVDDHQRRLVEIDRQRFGFGLQFDLWHRKLPHWPATVAHRQSARKGPCGGGKLGIPRKMDRRFSDKVMLERQH